MKWRYHLALVALVGVLTVAWLIHFGVADFFNLASPELQDKPWRPQARLAFAAVAIPIFLFFLSAYCKSVSRER